MKMKLLFLASLMLAVISTTCPANPEWRDDKLSDKIRVAQIKDMKWGMFVCLSFSTFSGKEWTPGEKDVGFFSASDCDTDQWARTAKEASMGYIFFSQRCPTLTS